MTGRKANKGNAPQRKKATRIQQSPNTSQQVEDSQLPPNIKKEQPPQPQVVKKIAKVDNDEARTLNTVFKSNPDAQMKDFIKKAVVKPGPSQAVKALPKTPAETHPPAVVQELLETDDDVTDNLGKVFKVSKSYKNI